jgi:iron complex outermembrane recepter protein
VLNKNLAGSNNRQLVCLSAISLVFSASALAQTGTTSATEPAAQPEGLREITVTAERREENVQTTPIAISAESGETLRSQSITDLSQLGEQIPNINVGADAGSAQVYIRGVGYAAISPGGETRVALYSDGIYLARTQGAFLNYYDIASVEVLRGPQGTLYGRNATAGAINTITVEPSNTVSGYYSQTLGDYGLAREEGAIGGPLSSTVSGRLAFQVTDRYGYGKNITTGQDVNDDHNRNLRLKLKFAPTDDFFVRLETDYSLKRDHSGGYRYTGVGSPPFTYRAANGQLVTFPGVVPLANSLVYLPPSNPQDAAGFGPDNRLETFGVSLLAEWKVAPDTKITSLTGFRHLTNGLDTNSDGTSSGLTRQYIYEGSNSFSQELRLQQDLGSIGDLLLGGYFFREHNDEINRVGLDPFTVGIGTAPAGNLAQGYETFGDVLTEAEAAFMQANFHVTEQLGVTLGVRYSHEMKTAFEGYQFDLTRVFSLSNPPLFLGTQNDRLPLSRTDPKVVIDYKLAEGVFSYLSYSRAFKSGGFNLGALQAPFAPEVLTSYEAGLKTEAFDRRLRANFAAFFYNYTNLQVAGTVGNGVITTNANAHIKGVEAELTALPTPDLKLELNLSYLDAKYTQYMNSEDARQYLGVENLAGNYLDQSPPYSADFSADYTFHSSLGDFTPRFNVVRTGTVYFSEFNRPEVSQPAFTKVNLYGIYDRPGTGWSGNVFVKNVTNKTYLVGQVINAGIFGYPVSGLYGAPRTYGVQVTKSF